MLKKFLEEVMVIIVGKQAEELADLLHSSKHVNEFILAKKLGITINQTRNMLYKISDYGLVTSIRKKDKKKGWYTYFWKIEVVKALEFLKETLVKRMEQILNQIRSRESKQFYVCELCKVEFNEENALLRDFTCSECGNVFVVKDNSTVLRELRKNYSKIEKYLVGIQEEIDKEQAKLDRAKEKEIRKIKKEEDAKKALRRKNASKKAAATRKRKAEKKKEEQKKSVKKGSVKKPVRRTVKKSVKKKSAKKSSRKSVKKSAKKTIKKTAKKKIPAKKFLKKTKKSVKTSKKKVSKRK